MMNIFRSMAMALFFWWYGDHVISSNRGRTYGIFFLFTPSYWWGVLNEFRTTENQKNTGRKKRVINEKSLGIGESESETLDSATIEQNKIIEDEEKDIYCDGLRIIDLSKTFFKFGKDRTKDLKAVNSVYLEVPKNELLCLLGHNGAGKSTLFNMLTGMISPTSGYAKIAGLDIRTQLD